MAKLSKFHKRNPPKMPVVKPTVYLGTGFETNQTQTSGLLDHQVMAIDQTPCVTMHADGRMVVEERNEAGFLPSRIPTFMEMVRKDRQNPAAIFTKNYGK